MGVVRLNLHLLLAVHTILIIRKTRRVHNVLMKNKINHTCSNIHKRSIDVQVIANVQKTYSVIFINSHVLSY